MSTFTAQRFPSILWSFENFIFQKKKKRKEKKKEIQFADAISIL